MFLSIVGQNCPNIRELVSLKAFYMLIALFLFIGLKLETFSIDYSKNILNDLTFHVFVEGYRRSGHRH
jgi:hypothetical protein